LAEATNCGKKATAVLTKSKHSADKSFAGRERLAAPSAVAEYRITRDHGGLLEDYKVKYAVIRDHGERVIIDGVCNSGCTLVLGIVPLNRVCVTTGARLGFHMAYYDKATTFGVKVIAAGRISLSRRPAEIGPVRNLVRSDQCKLGPLRKRLRSPEVTRASKVRPSR
jgi:hypothetical protein